MSLLAGQGSHAAWEAHAPRRDALAPWASHPQASRGRRVPEPASPPRNEHQRDRDRIVHSGAFRRLVYKTQVFINHEGDLFRTRMTHSLEVAQLARSLARMLLLNEDLVEAIALAHDLGHTPFGHAGQEALHRCMHEHGGFEHNLQSLRVVDSLEQRYAAFDGLNLTLETRAGILKHCSPRDAQRLCATEPGGPAQRFLRHEQPSLEAQLVNLADEMAYSVHDIDDGLRSGLLDDAALVQGVPLVAQARSDVLSRHGQHLAPTRLRFETGRRLLSMFIDAIHAGTQAQMQLHRPADALAVAALPPLVVFPEEFAARVQQLKRHLFAHLYRHPQVMGNTAVGQQVVRELFAAYLVQPADLPEEHRHGPDVHRRVADYVAGMTDRFAQREHERLTGQRLFAS